MITIIDDGISYLLKKRHCLRSILNAEYAVSNSITLGICNVI